MDNNRVGLAKHIYSTGHLHKEGSNVINIIIIVILCIAAVVGGVIFI
jgi:flagellar basal body-associated protein FliL